MVKKFMCFVAVVLCAGFVAAGEKSAVQNQATQKQAVQKSATQKGDAVQKGDVEVSGRFRSRRAVRVEARRSGWAVYASCRSGSCS